MQIMRKNILPDGLIIYKAQKKPYVVCKFFLERLVLQHATDLQPLS